MPSNPNTTKIDCQIPDGFRLMIPFNAEYEKEGEALGKFHLTGTCQELSSQQRVLRTSANDPFGAVPRSTPSMRMIQTTDKVPNTDA